MALKRLKEKPKLNFKNIDDLMDTTLKEDKKKKNKSKVKTEEELLEEELKKLLK